MQLFSRAELSGTKLNALASTLSLAIANYKPVPQLPTTSQISKLADTTNAKQLTSAGGSSSSSYSQHNFQTKTDASNITSSVDDNDSYKNNSTEWGQASILYVEAQTPNSRVAAKSATIGPGKCAIQTEYTPVGGWDALPAPEFAAFDPVMANVYRYRQQQGVNLGAW